MAYIAREIVVHISLPRPILLFRNTVRLPICLLFCVLALALGFFLFTPSSVWAVDEPCPLGQVWSGNSCTSEADRTCFAGFIYVQDQGCVLAHQGICGASSYVMMGGRCQLEHQACTAGEAWRDGSCQTRDETSCPAGQEHINGFCRDIVDPVCPVGYKWSSNRNRCVDEDARASCPSGHVWLGNRCTSEVDRTCPSGFVYSMYRGCVPDQSNICGNSRYILFGGRCQRHNKACEAGEVWRDGSCQTRDEASCPAGWEMVNGSCRRILENFCPPGSSWIESRKRCGEAGDDNTGGNRDPDATNPNGDGGNPGGDNPGDDGNGAPSPQPTGSTALSSISVVEGNTAINVELEINRPLWMYEYTGASADTWYLMQGIDTITLEARWQPAAPPSSLAPQSDQATELHVSSAEDPVLPMDTSDHESGTSALSVVTVNEAASCQTVPFTSGTISYDFNSDNLQFPDPPDNTDGIWDVYIIVTFVDIVASFCDVDTLRIPDRTLTSATLEKRVLQATGNEVVSNLAPGLAHLVNMPILDGCTEAFRQVIELTAPDDVTGKWRQYNLLTEVTIDTEITDLPDSGIDWTVTARCRKNDEMISLIHTATDAGRNQVVLQAPASEDTETE